jgi:flagellar hook-associated protein 3 FlgL
MRVTTSMFPEALIEQLNQLGLQQQQLQMQAATGQRVRLPEDDPSAMRRVLDMQAEDSRWTQYQSNISRLQEQATASSSTMQDLKTISDRIGEIATLADGTKSQQDLNTYAAEVTQLIQQAAQLMNAQFQGNYLFGGTLSNQSPFVVATDSNGNVTGVSYRGNASVTGAEIAPSVTLSVQTVGANTTGSGPQGLITDSRSGADFFNHMISLQNHLLAGDTAAIANTDHAQLALDEQNIISQIATNAAIQSRLDTADSVTKDRSASLQKLISNEADADLAQTLTRLNQTQTAYTAALQTGAKILNLSLLDYLH